VLASDVGEPELLENGVFGPRLGQLLDILPESDLVALVHHVDVEAERFNIEHWLGRLDQITPYIVIKQVCWTVVHGVVPSVEKRN